MRFSSFVVGIFFLAVVCFSHIHQGTLVVDGIRYAHLSLQVINKGEFFELVDGYRGGMYANKPLMLIWITAAAIKTLGFSTFSAKLPAVIFTFLAFVVMFFTARRFGEAVALVCIALLVANRSFGKDLVDFTFDGFLLFGAAGFLWLGLGIFSDRAKREEGKSVPRFGFKHGLIGGLSLIPILQSKPPYLVLVLLPTILCLGLTKRWHVVLKPSFFVPILSSILLGALWYILLGQQYSSLAAENQIGEAFRYINGSTLYGYFINLLVWMRSFWFTLAPLSWVSAWSLFELWRQVRTEGWRSLPPEDLFLGVWLLQIVPVILVIAVRPRYLWVPLIAGAILGPKLLVKRKLLPSVPFVRSGMFCAAVLVLILVWAFGVQFHRSDSVVRAMKRDPALAELIKTGDCSHVIREAKDSRYIQQLNLLLELEFNEKFPLLVNPASEARGSNDKNAKACRSLLAPE